MAGLRWAHAHMAKSILSSTCGFGCPRVVLLRVRGGVRRRGGQVPEAAAEKVVERR